MEENRNFKDEDFFVFCCFLPTQENNSMAAITFITWVSASWEVTSEVGPPGVRL